MKKTILLTGWLWYIWSHTATALLESWYHVIIIDNCSNASPKVLDAIEDITKQRPVFYQGDVTNETILQTIFSDHNIDAVIHFAAKKAVGESMEIPLEYYHNNITGTQTLLRIMDQNHVRTIIFSSTCAVYSDDNQPPYTEAMPTKPESVYAITKRINEEMIEWLVLSGKLSACILRYFNPIGNHPSAKIGEDPSQTPLNIMPLIMDVCEQKRDKLLVFWNTYPTPDGTCIRDYLHVMDLAEAHVVALERLLNQPQYIYDIFNLWTGNGSSVLELITSVQETLWISLPYEIIEKRAGDLPMVYGNCDKAKQILWRTTKRTLQEAILDTWNFRMKKKDRW